MATWLSDYNFPARLPSARAARAFPSASPVRSSCSSGFRSRCGDRACTRWQPGCCHSLQTLLQDCSVPTLPESSPLRRRPQQCAVAAPQVISPGAGSPFSVAAAGAAVSTSTRDEQNMHSFIRRSLQLARAGYVQCVHNKKCNCLQDRKVSFCSPYNDNRVNPHAGVVKFFFSACTTKLQRMQMSTGYKSIYL